jgi:hypothetical protein
MKFITTYQVGRKCRNRLAESVRAILIEELETIIKNGTFVDAGYWRMRVAIACKSCQDVYTSCTPIHVSEHTPSYDKNDPNRTVYFSLYHSGQDTVNDGSFLTLGVISEEKYYTPSIKTYMSLNKECKHLYNWVLDNYKAWRRGEGSYMSPFFIAPQTAKDALSHEYARNAVNERTVTHIKLNGHKIDVISVTPTKTLTAFSITFKPLWGK